MEKNYKSVIEKDIFNEFSVQKGYDLYSHACNGCIIEDYLAIANMFSPEIIEIDNYIFLASMFEEKGDEAKKKLRKLEKQFTSKKDIEKWVNSKSIGEFFIDQDSPSLNNDLILDQFCNTLKYYWELRFKTLFPQRKIVVEIGNEIMGELGLSVTVYEEYDMNSMSLEKTEVAKEQ